MDTPERSEGALSPWSPPSTTLRPVTASWSEPPPEAVPARLFSTKMIFRGLRRHWWQILAIWLVGSSALVYLAYTKIRPTFDAYALLNVEPASRSLLAPNSSPVDFGPYLETQVLLITSPDVLSDAIRSPDVAALAKVRTSADPEIELRKEITVAVPQKGTHLIMVKMNGENSSEIAMIINAVVKSYLDKSKNWTDEETRAQVRTLQEMENQYKTEIDTQRLKVRELARKNGVNPDEAIVKAGKDGKADGAAFGMLQITMDQYRSLRTELSRVQMEKHKTEAAVKFLEGELKSRGTAGGQATGPLTPEQVEAQVQQEFLGSSQINELNRDIAAAENKFELAMKRIKRRSDPAYKRAEGAVSDLKNQYEDLWVKMYPMLKRRVIATANGTGPVVDGATISQEAELRHARLELQQARLHQTLLEQQIREVEVEAMTENKERFEVQFAQEDLRRLEGTHDAVMRSRQQLEYEARNGTRIKTISLAKPTRTPASNNRFKAMAAAPVIMLLLACGLFVLVEAKSGRVSDPDEFSQRVRVGVIGVVPPLPSLNGPGRSLSLRGQQSEKRRVEEFIQSLDHLRVTLCAQRPGMSSRRCVLITSATGGEGKTTLAAQLAGRCANAGLMTLLIDADLRRPSLGDLLEVPEGPGLVDVLTGDTTPEAAMVVIGNAGGFHLLPAGTMGQDPSRLLHGERLGQVIARFRETFDIVIIDAPPVLAVPDALLLGRWTDGAVLAVRHDASRFPLVERANKRLTSVGVPVIGAVVNGCRTMESAYGSYRYTPYAAAEAPGAEGDAEV